MKKSKKFVLAGLALLAITMVLLPLSSCKTEVDTSSPQQEQTKDTNDNAGTGDNDSTNTEDNTSGGSDSGTGGGDTGDSNTNSSGGGDTDNGNNDNDALVITTGDPAAFIDGITAAGTYTLVATNECTDTAAIKEALRSLESRQPEARIHLNLSQSGITSIGTGGFQSCSSLVGVEIPASVTSIGIHAFTNCMNLASVTIPTSVASIGDRAFQDCSSLASVTFAEGSRLEIIGVSAFYGCSSLVSVEIPTSVTSIGNYAFSGCGSLASVKIPSSVTSIGIMAFYGCSELSTVKVEAETPPSLGTHVFDLTHADLKIQVPSSFVDDYKTADNWSDYEDNIEAITS